jgi:hypothetical protein
MIINKKVTEIFNQEIRIAGIDFENFSEKTVKNII